MKCNKVIRLLNQYVDQELIGGKTIALMEKHLSQCVGCKQQYNNIIALKTALSQKEKITASDKFLVNIQDKLKPAPEIIKLNWQIDTGNFARRLLPVPIIATVLVSIFLFININKAERPFDLLGEDVSVINEGVFF